MKEVGISPQLHSKKNHGNQVNVYRSLYKCTGFMVKIKLWKETKLH